MIGLIDFSADISAEGVAVATERLREMPAPPALRWSGFVINAGAASEQVLAWSRTVWRSRPWLPIALLLPDACWTAHLLATDSFAPVLVENEGGSVTGELLTNVRDRSVEADILRGWRSGNGGIDEDALATLGILAGIGIMGGRRSRAAGHLNISISTLDRRLGCAGLPNSHWLLRDARIRSVEIRRDLGMSRLAAVRAAGWSDVKAWEKMRQRQVSWAG